MAFKHRQSIQNTNDECTAGKAYAVLKQYWKDPYVQFFASPVHKSPEINRGYFARSQALKALVFDFVKTTNRQCQIVSLGAGSDTLYFQLRDSNLLPMRYVELDLARNVDQKIKILRRSGLFESSTNSSLSENSPSHPTAGDDTPSLSFHSDPYHLIEFDLSRPVAELITLLTSSAMSGSTNVNNHPLTDPTIPTLFLAECVLVYLAPKDSHQLLTGLASNFPLALFLHYEQVNMNDRFGEVMIENFRFRGCHLPGTGAWESLASQQKRFSDSGWVSTKAWTIDQIYSSFPPSTRARIEKVEFLDDLEIAHQLYDHYCIVVASTVDEPSSLYSWSVISEPLSHIN